jgi:hypothetical protein
MSTYHGTHSAGASRPAPNFQVLERASVLHPATSAAASSTAGGSANGMIWWRWQL